MRRKTAQACLFTGLLATLPILSLRALADDKVALIYRATKGQVMRYSGGGTLGLELGGQKQTMEIKETSKTTVTEVGSDGSITYETVNETRELTVAGQKVPESQSKKPTKIVIKSDGTLMTYDEGEQKEQGDSNVSVRLRTSSHPIFVSKAVGVGDKWTVELKADEKLGTVDAKAEFEVVSFGKIKGIDSVKVKEIYKESSGSSPLTVKSVYDIEISSGDAILRESEIENLSLGEQAPTANGKLSGERTEGSPFTGKIVATSVKKDEKKKDDKKGKKDDKKAVEPPKSTETKPADPPKKDEKKEKTIDETVKDYEKIPGLFTLYKKKESGRETVYMEIKESQLDKLHLLQATMATGTSGRAVAGNPINDLVFKFCKIQEDKLYLVTPNIAFRAKEGTPISRSLKRSFPDAYLDSFKIEAKQEDRKSLLINMTDFFKGDISQVSQTFAGGGGLFGGGGIPYSLDREKTFISAWKNFPENLTVETNYHFAGSGRSSGLGVSSDQLADPRSIPLKVIYNLWELKDTAYKPRLADSRVGYFTTDYQTFDVDDKADSTKRFILRWNLEKKDPKEALSEPKKPIVFWLDNAIPMQYRTAVSEGILMWNKALEKIGIKNGIQVKQMPDNADWDTADMRYNTIRWVSSPDSGYAVALFRANPLTGEIVNASITVDSNFVRYIKLEKKENVNPASYWQWQDRKPEPFANKNAQKCEYGEGMMEQGWFGATALSMLAPEMGISNEEYLHQYLREVVVHEMGHIMGLRHNFIGSTLHDDKQLADPKLLNEEGVTASVMEYGPFNVYALKHKDVPFYSSTIGPYDLWAIQYGYVPVEGTMEAEVSALKKIASRTNEPGLAYQSDEHADSFDPAVTRFDLGKDSLNYWEKNLEISRLLMNSLGSRLPLQGDSYVDFTRGFSYSLGSASRAGSQIGRYIGGLHFGRNFKGDPGEKPMLAPIDGDTQRRALMSLAKNILAENAFVIPKEYLVELTTDPYSGFAGFNSFPVKDQVASIQRSAVNYLFSPGVLSRISNNEFKTKDFRKALTLPEVFTATRKAVWSELEGKRNIGVLHRELQRAYLDALFGMVLSSGASMPNDAKMLAWHELKQVRKSLELAGMAKDYDTYTRLHLEDSAMKINRVLDAKLTISTGASGVARPLTLADLLGGKTGE